MSHEKKNIGNLVHVTTVHPRRDVRILNKECRSLATEFGCVHLVVGDGLGDEVVDDVHVVDIGAKPSGRIARMLFQPWRAYARVLALKPDVVHFHDPELLFVGLLLTWRKIKVVYDSHEDVPRQILSKHWIPTSLRGLISAIFERLENFISRRLSGVVAATPHIEKRFLQINPNTVDVNNYPLANELAPTGGVSVRRRQICYIGGLGRSRGLEPLVRAMSLVPEIRLILCGRFSESGFESELRALPGWKQVHFLGHVDRKDVSKVMAESFAGLVTLFPTPAYLDSLPIKMFEYMSAELPVIASDFPLWRGIIDNSGSGLCVDPASPDAIATAIRQLADDQALVELMGKAGRNAVLTQYNWAQEAEKLIQFYEDLP